MAPRPEKDVQGPRWRQVSSEGTPAQPPAQGSAQSGERQAAPSGLMSCGDRHLPATGAGRPKPVSLSAGPGGNEFFARWRGEFIKHPPPPHQTAPIQGRDMSISVSALKECGCPRRAAPRVEGPRSLAQTCASMAPEAKLAPARSRFQ